MKLKLQLLRLCGHTTYFNHKDHAVFICSDQLSVQIIIAICNKMGEIVTHISNGDDDGDDDGDDITVVTTISKNAIYVLKLIGASKMKRRSQPKTRRSKNTYGPKMRGRRMMYGPNPHYKWSDTATYG